MESTSLLARAEALLAANTRRAPHRNGEAVFTVPSATHYPFQWFWDSCFHAVVWAQIKPSRAEEEIRALLSAQDERGFIPHVIFWDSTLVSRTSWHYLESEGRLAWLRPGRTPRWTSLMQPPVLAQAVEHVVNRGSAEFLGDVLEPVGRYYRYLASARDPDQDGLISIISRFESGLDFSPAYDAAARRTPGAITLAAKAVSPLLLAKAFDFDLKRLFRWSRWQVEDVLVNSVYADGLYALASLANRADDRELEQWARRQADAVTESLLERCYDKSRRFFVNLNGVHERPASHVKTIVSLIPLLLPLPKDVVDGLVEHLTNARTFWTPSPIPSVAIDEDSFTRDSRIGGHRLIWRGPSSMSTNWLIWLGLRRHGHGHVADQLAARSREMVERSGFNEFFDPLSGAGVGESDFGWATLAAVMTPDVAQRSLRRVSSSR